MATPNNQLQQLDILLAEDGYITPPPEQEEQYVYQTPEGQLVVPFNQQPPNDGYQAPVQQGVPFVYTTPENQGTVPHNQPPQHPGNYQVVGDNAIPPNLGHIFHVPQFQGGQYFAGGNNFVMHTPEHQAVNPANMGFNLTPDNQPAVVQQNDELLLGFWDQLHQGVMNILWPDEEVEHNEEVEDGNNEVAVVQLVQPQNFVFQTPPHNHGQNPLNFWQAQPANVQQVVQEDVAPEDWGYETP